jgi:hypothetical protein
LNGEKDFKNLINSYYGGWPLIDNRFDPNQKILDKMIINERFGSNQLFRFYTFPNGNDPRFFILTVTKIILNFILLKLKKKYLR